MPDLRTKEGRRQEIIDYVRKNGGFSIFWVTDNHLRAVVATEMVENKELIEPVSGKGEYPWCSWDFALDENIEVAPER